jgi:hypothetical protein
MIVDILDRHDPRQFGLSGRFTRVGGALTLRSEPGEQAAAVDQSDVHVAEAHDVVAGFKLAMPTGSLTNASPMKTNSPFHLIAADAAGWPRRQAGALKCVGFQQAVKPVSRARRAIKLGMLKEKEPPTAQDGSKS